MKLVVVAGMGSPWVYATLETLAEVGAEIHLLLVAPEGEQAYIAFRSPEWEARRRSLYERMVSVEEIASPSTVGRMVGLARKIKRTYESHAADAALSLYGGKLGLAVAWARCPRSAIYAVGSDILAVRPLYRPLVRTSLLRVSIVFANGEALAQSARELAPRANVHNLLLGIDTSDFAPDPERQTSPVRILCGRGFKPVYNNLQILKALALLPEPRVPVEIRFPAGGELLASAREWADNNLSSDMLQRVRFDGGLAPDAMRLALKESHLFVSMSRSDGTSTTILEALCAGSVAVLSDIPANQSWAEPNHLVKLDDPVQLARVLDEMIHDDQTRAQIASKWSAKVTQEADARVNLKALLLMLSALP